ncbi:MAG TPA: class I SAM-dependent methyltransferase [Jatrophihabitans sp.]|nr:class I SAM-dependent methyltransferase [Jatrophihabitans sp.]
MADARWNHNIHYQQLVLRLLPPGTRRALDVGCGEGLLTRELAAAGVPAVVGVDRDAGQLDLARAAGGGPSYILGDFLTTDLGESFDFVATIATLHHVDLRTGLRRLRSLVAPGGRLVVIGLGARSWPADLPWDAAGFVVHRWHRARRGLWQHSAPIADPSLTNAQTVRVARAELPGVRFRRLVLFRHLIVWDAH